MAGGCEAICGRIRNKSLSNKIKKYVFVGVLLTLASTFVLGHWIVGAGVIVALLVWLAVETKKRTRLRFLAGNPSGSVFKEVLIPCGDRVDQLVFSAQGQGAAAVSSDGSIVLFDRAGRLLAQYKLEKAPLAVLPAKDLIGIYISDETHIRLLGLDGAEKSNIEFEPPEFRQGYSLKQGAMDDKVFLHTPWFVKVFSSDLSAQVAALSSTEIGNYMKYLKLSAQADSFITGGALLLEEDAGIQARWSVWDLLGDRFVRRWLKEDEGPANSHLRGLAATAASGDWVVERYRDGYDILIYHPDGTEKWVRPGGERPRLSPNGQWLNWMNPFDGLSLTDLSIGEKKWIRPCKEKVRISQVDDQGQTLSLEGRHLVLTASSGEIIGDDWFYLDPFLVEASPDEKWWVLVRQGNAAVLTWGAD